LIFGHASANFNVGWTQIFESKFSSFPLRSHMRALFCANESNSNVEFKGLLTFPQFSLPPRHTPLAPFFPKSQKWSQPPPTFLYVNQYCHRRPTGSGCSSIDNRRPIFCIPETPKLARMYNVLDSFVYSSTSLL